MTMSAIFQTAFAPSAPLFQTYMHDIVCTVTFLECFLCVLFMGSIRFNILNSILKIERTWKLEAPRGFPKEADDAFKRDIWWRLIVSHKVSDTL